MHSALSRFKIKLVIAQNRRRIKCRWSVRRTTHGTTVLTTVLKFVCKITAVVVAITDESFMNNMTIITDKG